VADAARGRARPGSAARRASTRWRWWPPGALQVAGHGTDGDDDDVRRRRQSNTERVVRLGLVMNGPTARGNREKVIFGCPLIQP
jgi:hypothetical protein